MHVNNTELCIHILESLSSELDNVTNSLIRNNLVLNVIIVTGMGTEEKMVR